MYIIIAVMLLFSAFCSASEAALSSVNKIRLKKQAGEGSKRAKAVLGLIDNYEKNLTIIIVGNNLASVGASTIGTLILADLFSPAVAAGSSTFIFTFLYLLVEILPKTFARRNSEKVAFKIPGVLKVSGVILYPLVVFFRLLQSLQKQKDSQPSITEGELLHFIESIEEEGVLEEEESKLVKSALEFDETTIREVITPRVDLEALDADSTREEIEEFLSQANHSRAPVYETSVDNIIGVFNLRDAMRKMLNGQDVSIREIMEEPHFVHKGMKVSALVSIFKTQKVRMAVVLDEYGGTVGIVTPTDLLEDLVGDLYSERSKTLIPCEDGSTQIDGGYYLWDMFDKLGIDTTDIESDYSTVNGWAMSIIGFIPEGGESFEFRGYHFSVTGMDGNKISTMRAQKKAESKEK